MFGYFIMDGIVAGVSLPISFSSTNYESGNKYTYSSFAFAPFGRYYYDMGTAKPYGHIEFGIGSSNSKTEYSGDSPSGDGSGHTSSMVMFGLGGGIAIVVADNVIIDLGLKYKSNSYKPTENNESNYRTIYSGIYAGVGVVVTIPGVL